MPGHSGKCAIGLSSRLTLRYFAIGSLAVWLCDKLSGGVQAAHMHVPTLVDWNSRSGIITLTLPRASFRSYQPGQYFLANIPNLSLGEWRPLAASAVLADALVFHVQSIPRIAAAPSVPAVRLRGPFGHTDFGSYENVLLFAGGVGITPLIASFTTFLREALAGRANPAMRSVVLVLMSRAAADLKTFSEVFALAGGEAGALREAGAAVKTATCAFHVRLHCTDASAWSSLCDPQSADHVSMFVTHRRCDVAEVFQTFGRGRSSIAAVCGSPALAAAVSRQAWASGTDFHAEQFGA